MCIKLGCGFVVDCGEGGVCCLIFVAGLSFCFLLSCFFFFCDVFE